MRNEGLIKNFTAQGAIPAYRIAKFGSADGTVVAAAAVSDLLLGVSTRVPADAAGDRVDIVLSGIAEVEYGGNVTRGAKLTANASGAAVAAAPSAGANNQIIGIAMVSGVAGDIGAVMISQSVLQG
jgi:hypothetical protein